MIKIGTLIGGYNCPELINKIKGYGFETFAINFSGSALNGDLNELSKKVEESLGDSGIKISSVGVYGNTLTDSDIKTSFENCIKAAKLFGTNIVAGFTGGISGEKVENSIDQYKKVFGELSKLAESEGVKIAFENCSMGGTWDSVTQNIALNPKAWELMFNALPCENLGLQWEPCHQMVQLIEPMPQIRKWAKRMFHIHGKDATIAWDVIKEHGILGTQRWCWHRTPGFGDSNWTDIISMLMMNGYQGSIDIEGWHDPIYRDKLEYTGQIRSLNYLKQCRGGDYIEI